MLLLRFMQDSSMHLLYSYLHLNQYQEVDVLIFKGYTEIHKKVKMRKFINTLAIHQQRVAEYIVGIGRIG